MTNEPKSYHEKQAIFWKDKFYDRKENEIGIVYGQAFNLAHAQLLELSSNSDVIEKEIRALAQKFFIMLMSERKQVIDKHLNRIEEDKPIEVPKFKPADKIIMPALK